MWQILTSYSWSQLCDMINSNVIKLRASRDMMLSNYSNSKTQSSSLTLAWPTFYPCIKLCIMIFPKNDVFTYIHVIELLSTFIPTYSLISIWILLSDLLTLEFLSCYCNMGIWIKYADWLIANNVGREAASVHSITIFLFPLFRLQVLVIRLTIDM